MANTTAAGAVTTPYSPTADTSDATSSFRRVASIDVLRGLVVVLMAIDHVRVYSAVPAGGPDPGVFFTRWVTHFVAPVFVFLAGTGAFLYGRRVGVAALSKFLLTRGLILLALELTVIRFSWTFNLDYGTYMLAGVIWVIGWSMIVLAALAWLPTKVVGALGLAIIVGHNLLPGADPSSWLPKVLYYGGAIQFGENGPSLVILYTLIPWVGVMAAGYALGALYDDTPAERRAPTLMRMGIGAVVLFVVLRFAGVYGDPSTWNPSFNDPWPALRTFLSTAKYPASLQFLLMTLGPALVVLALLERRANRFTSVMEVFGRVPMFYYLLHIPLIHLLAVIVSLVRSGSVTPWLFGNHPMWPSDPPPGYRWSLWLLYAVTAVAVTVLYFACRWYAREKAIRPKAWMKYI